MVIIDFLRDAFWGGVDWFYENRWVFWLIVLSVAAVALYFLGAFAFHVYARVIDNFDWKDVPDLTPKQFDWSVLVLLFLIWIRSTSFTVHCKHKECGCKK